ncbi:hypothetical protein [Paenibacillus sp. FSL H3-0286]|uniref:hypothetical protein n=1 Tax=Paenibacillus sp. FSL H3-0286 TaxID=2921427 RepID=UPI00324C3F07
MQNVARKRVDLLLNHLDDGMLYVDGEAWNDIGWREADSILMLKEPLEDVVQINLRQTNLLYEEFPKSIELVADYQI